jgi:hypothetical protein
MPAILSGLALHFVIQDEFFSTDKTTLRRSEDAIGLRLLAAAPLPLYLA